MRTAPYAVLGIVLWMGAGAARSATMDACDSFGQDWKITLGPFGGTYPGSLLISGCRDCDGSLGCGAPLPLDGVAVLHGQTGAHIWSVTAYSPVGSANCLTTHWTGLQRHGKNRVMGNVSNNSGPFGGFVLTLKKKCDGVNAPADPSTYTAP